MGNVIKQFAGRDDLGSGSRLSACFIGSLAEVIAVLETPTVQAKGHRP